MFFFISLFGFWTKKYSNFPQKIFSRVRGKRSTCPEQQFVENCESKKALKQKILGEFFDKSRTFHGKFLAVLSKLHSSCQATFDGKQHLRVNYWLVICFWTLRANSHGFGETASGTVVQTAFYVPKGEKIVSSNFWEKTLVLKIFVNLHDLTDS